MTGEKALRTKLQGKGLLLTLGHLLWPSFHTLLSRASHSPQGQGSTVAQGLLPPRTQTSHA